MPDEPLKIPADLNLPDLGMTEEQIRARLDAIGFNPNPRQSKYNTHWWYDLETNRVNPRQFAMLCAGSKEALFGGKPGGGKSGFILMAACQYLDVPGYSALILRRTWPQLSKAGGLIDMAHQWLAPWRDCWNEQKRVWKMPKGGTLQFGHCEHENDKYNFQGDEYSSIFFDELTQFSESIYEFLLTRLRRKAGLDVPLRVRSASNPGGEGHQWVKKRFIKSSDPQCIFVPSSLQDNPFLDRDAYQKQLEEIRDPVLRRQLLEGDWDAEGSGEFFKKEWFEVVYNIPTPTTQVRSWDVAGTIKRKDGRKSDETVGVLWSRDDKTGFFYVLDVLRFRATPRVVEDTIERTMIIDEQTCKTLTIEEKPPGEAGIEREEKRHKRFAGHWYRLEGSNRSKEERALAMSAAAERGLIKLYHRKGCSWIDGFLSELVLFGMPNMPDNVCLAPGTLVATDKGEIPIEQVLPGMKAVTRSGMRLILFAGKTDLNRRLVNITLSTGQTISATSNHRVWVKHRGFVSIDTVNIGCIMMTCKKTKSPIRELCSEDTLTGSNRHTGDIIDHQLNIPRRGFNLSIKRFGKMLMAQFLRVCTFTTRMETHLITPLKICNLSPQSNTPSFIRAMAVGMNFWLTTLKRYDLLPLNGTAHQKELSGTENTQRTASASQGRSIILSANNAEVLPSLDIHGRNFVPVNACSVGTIICQKTDWKESVPNVKMNSPLQNGVPLHTVESVVLAMEDGGRSDVYDITVEGAHEFFANGILVHNCDGSSLGFNALAFIKTPTFIRSGILKPSDLKNPFTGRVRVDSLGRKMR